MFCSFFSDVYFRILRTTYAMVHFSLQALIPVLNPYPETPPFSTSVVQGRPCEFCDTVMPTHRIYGSKCVGVFINLEITENSRSRLEIVDILILHFAHRCPLIVEWLIPQFGVKCIKKSGWPGGHVDDLSIKFIAGDTRVWPCNFSMCLGVSKNKSKGCLHLGWWGGCLHRDLELTLLIVYIKQKVSNTALYSAPASYNS